MTPVNSVAGRRSYTEAMPKSKPPKISSAHINLGYFVLAWMLVLLIQAWFQSGQVLEMSYSEFRQRLTEGQIANVQVGETLLRGQFKTPVDARPNFVVQRVGKDIADELDKHGVQYTAMQEQTWLRDLLSWVMPALVLVGLWLFVIRRFASRQGMGGLMNVGRSKARVYVEKATGVTFDDVAGVDEAKSELLEVVSFLTERTHYSRLGAHIPKGILLVGPPGCGKTLLARAVAGQAGVPFFSISGSEFVEMFVGVGAARVRDLFEQAARVAPCIVFIDELDSLGKARGAGAMGGGHDEKEQTLNQLLAELDGFDPSDGIVLLAATNRPEVLDPALLRAGRFDRRIVIDRPDKRGRQAVLEVHLRRIPTAQNLPVDQIAAMTPGFSGADLANLVNEAAIVATRRNADTVGLDDFTAAIERIVAGAERPGRLMNPHERQRVAWHEMGHALAAASLPGSDPVHKVSIIPRSIGSLGYTMQRPIEDRFLITEPELKDRMVVMMAGRAAEELSFGSMSTGAADDLAKVTDIARRMVTAYGMNHTLGQSVLERDGTTYLGENMLSVKQKDYSEATAREIDLAIRALVNEAYEKARTLLSARKEDLSAGVALLLEHETITPAEFAPLRPAPKP